MDLCDHWTVTNSSCSWLITNSLGLLQVYTVTIVMIGTYVHWMVTNSPGLLQVYTVTIAMIGTYVHMLR